MKEHPILFSSPMIRAILEGRKTQTRRVAKLPPAPNHLGEWEPTTIGGVGVVDSRGMAVPEHPVIWHTRTGKIIPCPYGQPGTRLWVRETFAYAEGGQVIYRASESDLSHYEEIMTGPWHPSIFLPRKFSRITLEIINVRPEKLLDITEADAIAEGVPEWANKCDNDHALDRPIDSFWCPRCHGDGVHSALAHNLGVTEVDCDECNTPVKLYLNLFNHINGKTHPQISNPWLWRIAFRVLEVLHG